MAQPRLSYDIHSRTYSPNFEPFCGIDYCIVSLMFEVKENRPIKGGFFLNHGSHYVFELSSG
jgi:hypothetical protein|nr:MAG TPA: hypothetical protein [Caudoviricetes sp.]